MTTTKAATIQSTLEKADPNSIADALRYLGLGKLFAPITVTVTGLTASATVDITSAAVKAAAVIVGIDALDDGEYLPALGCLLSLRVTASGTAGSVGHLCVHRPERHRDRPARWRERGCRHR